MTYDVWSGEFTVTRREVFAAYECANCWVPSSRTFHRKLQADIKDLTFSGHLTTQMRNI